MANQKAKLGDIIRWVNGLDFEQTGQVELNENGNGLEVRISDESPTISLGLIRDYEIIT